VLNREEAIMIKLNRAQAPSTNAAIDLAVRDLEDVTGGHHGGSHRPTRTRSLLSSDHESLPGHERHHRA
jgi:hypothetical protein